MALHEAEGLAVKVVDVADVYRRCNFGIVDPLAIRDFIAHGAAAMGTRYVQLVGGDTYDYRDDLGIGSISFIPTRYAETGFLITYSPVDPLYTDLDGDNVPDLPIGRLPVRTAAELDTMIDSIVSYAPPARATS